MLDFTGHVASGAESCNPMARRRIAGRVLGTLERPINRSPADAETYGSAGNFARLAVGRRESRDDQAVVNFTRTTNMTAALPGRPHAGLGAFGNQRALELRQRRHDVKNQDAARRPRIDRLGQRHQTDLAAVEFIHDLDKMR